jgi:Peptidase M50B-like
MSQALTWVRELLTEQNVPTSTWLVLAAFLAGCAITAIPQVWPKLRHLVTIVHEAGHAIVGVLAGRKLAGIRLHSDTSGVTATSGRTGGIGLMLTMMAGYMFPPVVSAAYVWAVRSGYAGTAALVTFGALVLVLVFTRNLYGFGLVTFAGAVLLAFLWWGPPGWIGPGLVIVAGVLVAGGVRTILDARLHRRSGLDGSDASALAASTIIPAVAWEWLFLLWGVAVPVGAWFVGA